MSEYWKSTPKYWCKHCKTFVRDTKLEKASHDATPKHQGNLKRFLRDLHRGHEREERDKQRAKDEVVRLNGVVSGSSASAREGSRSEGAPWRRKPAIPPPSAASSMQATPAERKQQLAQLAAMGVAIPEDFRREMAMAGDWQTLSERPVYPDGFKKEEDGEDVKPNNLNIGVRKRKFEGEEEEQEAGEVVVKRGWGSTTRTYPGEGEDDLDALIGQTNLVRRRDAGQQNLGRGKVGEPSTVQPGEVASAREEAIEPLPEVPSIKKEESTEGGGALVTAPEHGVIEPPVIKTEDDPIVAGIVFKKRKPKQIRQI